MAVQDVSVAFAKEMQNEHLQGLNTDKLVAFKIFGVNAAFMCGRAQSIRQRQTCCFPNSRGDS